MEQWMMDEVQEDRAVLVGLHASVFTPEEDASWETLDELRQFDTSYVTDTRSKILQSAAAELGIGEKDIVNIKTLKSTTTEAAGFEFDCPRGHFRYFYDSGQLQGSASHT